MATTDPARLGARFELFFRSLLEEGGGLSFPCDAEGHVDIDSLSDQARCDYFFARTLIGLEFALPAVQPSGLQRYRQSMSTSSPDQVKSRAP